MSSYEKNPRWRTDDRVAAAFLPRHWQLIVRYGPSRAICKLAISRHLGLYKFIFTRTRHIDAAIRQHAPAARQLVIFGAGFDSRAIRFQDRLAAAAVFEVDAGPTQQAKRAALARSGIEVPDNLQFVPVDLATDSLADALKAAGFTPGEPSLFLLEGLIYYLPKDAVEGIFRLLTEWSGPASVIVFDYAITPAAGDETPADDTATEAFLAKLRDLGEGTDFGIERGRVTEFLSGYGWDLIADTSADDLAQQWFDQPSFGGAVSWLSVAVARKP